MAVPEPGNELWAAVKAIDNTIWPPDNEDDATAIAQGWRKAGEMADVAGTELYEARRASVQAWRDGGGQAAGQQLGNGVVTLESQRRDSERQAALADRYAAALTGVKTAIVQNIEMNLPAYLQLANPVYGAAGAAMRQEFAQRVAADLKALVAGQAQGLQAPRQAPDTDTLLGKIGDGASLAAAFLGGLALIPAFTPVAAPLAAAASVTALAAHGVDMAATGSWNDPTAWATVGNDALGVVPGVKAMGKVVEAAGDLSKLAPSGGQVMSSLADTGLAIPVAADLFVNDPEVDQQKNESTWYTLAKNVGTLRG